MKDSIKFISLCGMLGYGYPRESLEAGLAMNPDFIGADNGSTDPGPYYLGSGKGFVKRAQIKRDLEPALTAAVRRKIPLIIGSAGGSGAKPHVEAFLDIVREISKANHLRFRMAIIYADVDKRLVMKALESGKITPCGPVPAVTPDKINKCTHLVGQMGTGPLIEALAGGADVIIVGRCCNTAIFAAPAIMRGFDPGLALHCAKIAECGALCARPVGANDSLFGIISRDNFIVEPLNPIRCCTPDSVAAHSLYEQPNPDCFFEPEGKIDMTGSNFIQISGSAIKVSGTKLIPAPKNTLKLEGAELKGYRAVTIAGIRDPVAIQNLDVIEKGVRDAVSGNLEGVIASDTYTLRFIRYGVDGVTGAFELPATPLPREVGLLIEAIASTQEHADTVISLARSTALHQPFPNRKATAGNLAFPFSPSDLQGGAVYEFSVYHLMDIEDEKKLFPVIYEEINFK